MLCGLLAALPGPLAAAAQVARDQGQGAALAAKIASGASRIHQLTEQVDQARMEITTTSGQLDAATRRQDQTVSALQADQGLLHAQAVTAYIHGPTTYQAAASGDLTLGREYLKVATGNLTDTTDRLRELGSDLRRSQTALRSAHQASLDAVAQAQNARDQALLVAADEQGQLDRIQRQAAAALVPVVAAQPVVRGVVAPSPAPVTQGLPVNNGLVAVVRAVTAVPGGPAPPPPVHALPTAAAPAAPPANTAGGVWLSLRQCESGDNYASNTGNGYFGAYQFSQGTWSGLGYPGRPDQEPPAMQDRAAAQLQAQSGWGQWPACSAALGLG